MKLLSSPFFNDQLFVVGVYFQSLNVVIGSFVKVFAQVGDPACNISAVGFLRASLLVGTVHRHDGIAAFESAVVGTRTEKSNRNQKDA